MKLIYAASPYVGDIQTNIEFAKRACRHVIDEGYAFLRLMYCTHNSSTVSIPMGGSLDLIWACYAAKA